MALGTRLDDEPRLDERDADDLDADEKRAYRARTEHMVVLPQRDVDGAATGLYDVHSESGKTYVVDATEGRCDCPDMTHNSPDDGCKHVKRVNMMLRDHGLPEAGEDTSDYMTNLSLTLDELEEELAEVREREVIVERLAVPLRNELRE